MNDEDIKESSEQKNWKHPKMELKYHKIVAAKMKTKSLLRFLILSILFHLRKKGAFTVGFIKFFESNSII